ncbi:MAG: hypothetical protein HOO96_10050 [Polyangiaceae bacterium]|nr:hypothetical protein [Polyangiaceae bacterium]
MTSLLDRGLRSLRSPVLASSLGLLACAQEEPVEDVEADQTIGTTLALKCSGETSWIGSGGTRRGETRVSGSNPTVAYTASLTKFYVPPGERFSVKFSQASLTTDDYMVLYARPAGSADPWRQVKIPFAVQQYQACAGGRYSWKGQADFLYQITVGTFGEEDKVSCEGASCLAIGFQGIPARAPAMQTMCQRETLLGIPQYTALRQIPALADIADKPLEWGIVGGIVRQTLIPFDGLAGSYSFDLEVVCPMGKGCVLPPGGSPASKANCGLPGRL